MLVLNLVYRVCEIYTSVAVFMERRIELKNKCDV